MNPAHCMADPVNAVLVQALLGYSSNNTTALLRRGFNYHLPVPLEALADAVTQSPTETSTDFPTDFPTDDSTDDSTTHRPLSTDLRDEPLYAVWHALTGGSVVIQDLEHSRVDRRGDPLVDPLVDPLGRGTLGRGTLGPEEILPFVATSPAPMTSLTWGGACARTTAGTSKPSSCSPSPSA